MRPKKLSAQVFLDLPPVLSHYIETARASWIESSPGIGEVTLFGRRGVFQDLDGLAIERRQAIQSFGVDRLRRACYRAGFEAGRREAQRHLETYEDNARLALQAGPIFAQVQGRFHGEHVRFEFDLESGMVYRELLLHDSFEVAAAKQYNDVLDSDACWWTAGFMAGQTSEVLQRRVIAREVHCGAVKEGPCRIVARLDTEWANDGHWTLAALNAESVESELAQLVIELAQERLESGKLRNRLQLLEDRLKKELLLSDLVGDSVPMRVVIARCKQLAATDAPVMLVGEAGTGRLTLAQGIHFAGPRRAGAFEILDAGSISPNLLEGELVGRGEWMGRSVQGAVARANRGTLYITELCALPADLQGVLLRTIEQRTVRPIGAAQAVAADARVIVSTDRDPQEAVSKGELRGDLFYALSVGRVDVPPLRERPADILGLAQRFVTDTCLRYGRREPLVSADFKRALLDCSWPGNVRQLRNVIEQVVLFAPERELTIHDIPDEVILNRLRPRDPELNPDLIRSVLRRTRGHRGEAAKLLGVGRSTLWRAMKEHGIA